MTERDRFRGSSSDSGGARPVPWPLGRWGDPAVRDRSIVLGVVVVLAIAVPVILAAAPGSGDGGEPTSTDDSFPTETPAASTAESGDWSTDTETTDADTGPSFAFEIDRIESCGETCRDVTTTLTSEDAGSTGVTVYTRIYAGNGTDGDVVWEGNEPIGDLAADESHTGTKRVDLSITDAYTIQQADGWITVQTTIQSEEQTVTTTDRRQVA